MYVDNHSVIVLEQLKTRLVEIEQKFRSGVSMSKDEIKNDLLVALKDFFKKAGRPRTTYKQVKVFDVPYSRNPGYNAKFAYSEFWEEVGGDVYTLFREAIALGNATVNNNNFLSGEMGRLTALVKEAQSKLNDYILYTEAAESNVLFFKDSFNSMGAIEFNSGLLDMAQADILQAEGAVTLPIETETQAVVSSVKILENSSGTVVANVLLDTLQPNNEKLFEYESRSSLLDLTKKLTLDFVVVLEEETAVNNIVIVPNNFGTRKWTQVETIAVSRDGKTYYSVMDEVLPSDFLKEESPFVLAPSVSSFAGEGHWTFTPKWARFVHIRLRQSEAYYDSSNASQPYRHAIGIEQIKIMSKEYSPQGALISTNFTTNHTVDKITMEANEYPFQSWDETGNLTPGAIEHYISVNDGASWVGIAPRYIEATTTSFPEVLNVNNIDVVQNPDASSSISTDDPVKQIRHKIVLTRQPTMLADATLENYYTPIVRSIALKLMTKEAVR